jgi:hypothetical protein
LGQLGLANGTEPAFAGPVEFDLDVEQPADGILRVGAAVGLGSSRAHGSASVEGLTGRPTVAGNVTIDPNRCQVGYRWRVEQDGRVISDQKRTVELRRATGIRVSSIDAEPGRQFFIRTYPKIYVVRIARWDNSSGDSLYFRDRDVAARVGTATRQAVKLCDSGERQSRRRQPRIVQ